MKCVPFGAKVSVVLVAVLHFTGYMRYFVVWVCGFVNCVEYFDKNQPSLQNCALAIGKKTVGQTNI